MTDRIADDPLIGQQLANFRLERVIGRGGMATVYYAVDVKLNRPVAVKVIDARYRGNPAYAERFIRESQVVATWRHANILQVYYADDESELYYFVMEYVHGMDLRELVDQYLADNTLMPQDDVLRIGFSVADALDYAHKSGVIHRDVKPSNVMVSFDGRVLLMDFGLALQITEGSMGEVFGTPHYMAPEQARRSADAVSQSDLYSLGILLFEMLTGAIPFDDQSPTSVAIMHITQQPPLPRDINPKLSVEVERVLLKALEKDTADRYQSGRELMDALQKALSLGGSDVNDLPPLPAIVQQQLESSISFPQNNHMMTVAERLVLELDAQSTLDHQSNPSYADTLVEVPGSLSGKIASWLKQYAVILLLLAVLGVGSGVGWQLYNSNVIANNNAAATVTAAAVLAAMPTETEIPPTAVATATDIPTETPAPTETPVPTAVPTEEDVVVVAPTETPAPTETLAPTETATPASDPSLLLIYDNDTFYVKNLTANRLGTSAISFIAIDREGLPTTYGFSAADWRETRISAGRCNGLEVGGSDAEQVPDDCDGINWVSFPGENSTDVFWLTRASENITQFEVLVNGVTVQTCATLARRCSVILP